jgi:hypothetical protein
LENSDNENENVDIDDNSSVSNYVPNASNMKNPVDDYEKKKSLCFLVFIFEGFGLALYILFSLCMYI